MKLLFHRKSLIRLGVLITSVLGLGYLVTRAATHVQARRLRTELAQIQPMLDAGRVAAAREKLLNEARHWPRDGEVLFLLGQCEERLGRPDRAIAAWEQIAVSDANFVRAVESQASLLINQGRFAPAEARLVDALRSTTEAMRYPLLRALARVLRLEGRFTDVGEVLTAAWLHSPEPSEVLQDVWQNDTEPIPVDGWKVLLDKADQDDDRVWLGRARHALLTGRFDEAQTWLGRCRERRPVDRSVWLAYLDLAVATEELDPFWRAAERIEAEALGARRSRPSARG